MQLKPISKLITLACAIAVACAVTAWAEDASSENPNQLVPVGLQKQLLVDDYVIAEKQNVTRALGKVQKHGIVMKPTLPTDFIPPRGQRGGDEDYEDDLKTGKKPDGSRVTLDLVITQRCCVMKKTTNFRCGTWHGGARALVMPNRQTVFTGPSH